jgi:membrane dipeptidase
MYTLNWSNFKMELDQGAMPEPIADLHCDLLAFLSRASQNSPYDPAVRCAIPQLRKGNVKIQVMAIFVETGEGSAIKGWKQAEIFKRLPQQYPEAFELLRSSAQAAHMHASEKIGILPAVENASAFCEEGEPFSQVAMQFNKLLRKIGKPAYVSLTWNSENRFGGGAATDVGLKGDGESLVQLLAEKGIPLDLSHASDRLAYDLLNFLERNNLRLSLIASHSNLRAVTPVPRNLPDDLAQEIMRRGGLIGLNFFRPFVESSVEFSDAGLEAADHFRKHLMRFLQLNGADHLCFGADFFHDQDLSPKYKQAGQPLFFEPFSNSSCYPLLLNVLRERHALPEQLLKNLAYHNQLNFILRAKLVE